jgi:hypothetical protein
LTFQQQGELLEVARARARADELEDLMRQPNDAAASCLNSLESLPEGRVWGNHFSPLHSALSSRRRRFE